MSHRNLIICDSELSYAYNLMEMVVSKKELALQVSVFSDLEGVAKFSKQHAIDFLLVEEVFPEEERVSIKAERTFVITRGICENRGEQEVPIYKYQSADKIFEQVLATCGKEEQEKIFFNCRQEKTKIIGMYSPISRVGQTTFALNKGKEWAEKNHTLYLNMETYAGIGNIFGAESYNLSDLMYFIKQEHNHFGLRLSSFVKQMEELDYIAPMPIVEDIRAITGAEWLHLLTQINKYSIYETLVLDMGDCIQEILEILAVCDEIYMLTLEDQISKSKVFQFEENLKLLGKENILERIIEVSEGNR